MSLVLTTLFALLTRAVAEAFGLLGLSVGGALMSIVTFVIGFYLSVGRKGTATARPDLLTFATAATPFMLVFAGVVAYYLLAIPYREYRRQRNTASVAVVQIETLTKTLEDRRHNVDSTEPGAEPVNDIETPRVK